MSTVIRKLRDRLGNIVYPLVNSSCFGNSALDITHGGTGATTNVQAIQSLGIYPIGAIYLSVDPTSPSSLFGGTWERISEGRVLFGAGTCDGITYNAGTTVDKGLPNITGAVDPPLARWYAPGTGYSGAFYSSNASVSKYTGSYGPEGGWRNAMYFDASRSNSIYGASTTVQPNAYVVYMWRRTA